MYSDRVVASVNSGVVGVVGKVALALLGGTAGGDDRGRGFTFCLLGWCMGDILWAVGVALFGRVLDSGAVMECAVEVEDKLRVAERVTRG